MSEQNVSNPELAPVAEGVDERIFELTGVQPDVRATIPVKETREYVSGIQAGDSQAMDALLATRVRWIYTKFAQNEVIKRRLDISEADIMQMGSLAVLETAASIDVDRPNFKEGLHKETQYNIASQIMNSKLVATIGERGHKLTNARYESQQERMGENVMLAGDRAGVAIAAHETTVNHGTPEQAVIGMEFPEVLRSSMDALGEAERYIIEARYGIGDFAGKEPQTLVEVGQALGVSRELVRRGQVKALVELGEVYERLTGGPLPRWTPQQQELQKRWLGEIERKQEAGEVAFVQGRLLERPLPDPLTWYLQTGQFNGEEDGAGLKAALEAAEVDEEIRIQRLTSVTA